VSSRWSSLLHTSTFLSRSSATSSPTNDQEVLLARGRILLAAGSLLAIYIDPIYRVAFARALHLAVLGFFFYSLLLVVLIWCRPESMQRLRLQVHLSDLLWLSCIAGFAQSANGHLHLFYPYALFLLWATAYRWGLYLTLTTAGAFVFLQRVSATVMGSWVYHRFRSQPADFKFEELARQAGYLLIAACVIGYLGQKESESRAKASVLTRVIGKMQSQATVRETLEAALGALLTIFDASGAVLVLKEEEKDRVFLWEGNLMPGTQRCRASLAELDQFQHQRYFFSVPGSTFHATRSPQDEPSRVEVSAFSASGDHLRKTSHALPDYFLNWHSFRSFLFDSFSLGEDSKWSGRLFLFDPGIAGGYETELRFLRELVREMAPVVHTIYRLRRIRSRASGIERARLARELHDGVIQTLTALHMRIACLRRDRSVGDTVMLEELLRLQQLIRREISNVRDLTYHIRSVDLSSKTLLESVADLVDKFRSDTGIATQLISESNDIVLPPLVAREIMRIIGEALTNVRKHSGARHARVCFGFKDNLLNLTIADDGRGFGFSGRLSQAELDVARRGPAVIRERVRSIGGELTLESVPGRGARLQISWSPNRQEQAV
jgi:signal transduction histidine kinase